MSYWSRRGVPARGDGDPPLYALLRVFCALVLVPLYRCRVTGAQNLPASGGVILAVTHKSWWDPIFGGMAVARPVRPMAKAELFRNRISRSVVTALGAFPIRRGESDLEAMRTSLAILAEGDILLMFPEGHRFHDDAVHTCHPGVAMLAARSGAAVVPVAVRGTNEMARKKVPRFPRVRMAVGEPVDLSRVEGRGAARYAAMSELIRRDMAGLYDRL